ncbi:tif224 [Candida oxycetoniae]|uniref:Translation initiation factor eIF2B subunit delta n=1 Tax=Candida oxycetoniae TaxID=497107 RepID=A0AAI9SZI8_9ASCO|nr:tif224 [Candida oxycetoniae]KAI3405690.2 tif224 [Candida oxycetoniae]
MEDTTKDSKSASGTVAVSKVVEDEEKKLSNKELKELKKKEKAAKRAARKEASGISIEQQEQMTEKKKQKAAATAAAAGTTGATATASNLKKQLNQTRIKGDKKVPHLFGHLETREQRNASSPTISHVVHPAILSLTLKYSSYSIVGSVARLTNMLLVFKQVIRDYVTPQNMTLARHLTGLLSHQIEYLKSGRPLSVSMGNAIRWLKQEISHVSIDTSEAKAKEILCQKIDDFIKEKIELSDRLIVENASKHVVSGSTILTYGHSQVLEELFEYCFVEQGKKFNLIIVDSRPLFEGKKLLRNLINKELGETSDYNGIPITKSHISVQYVLLNSLSSTLLEDVDCVFLGAHAMLSNGRLFARVGTALIAMMCHRRNIPVLTCCESIKFSDKVQLDSVTNNELADPEDLITNNNSMQPPEKKSFALEQFLNQTAGTGKGASQVSDTEEKDAPLKNWKNISGLNVLNIMYDLTPPEYINKVVTEVGSLPPSSVPVILREYKST